ncbi:X2-like carbohydrate binding domain-containing protein [Paenibacillus contaminans]|uniref:SLH domain-containing protein n=1 Tax=Paenibacillus contaminans TaxID=450362 RepID=A0A329LZN9_9BACL|nr:X2-like carbohydrate binding domain-containing protein [Paenibacillus contaminans]RAV13341.1 hypothetical protein DQG23_33590 [Paenibacillus contaminans]
MLPYLTRPRSVRKFILLVTVFCMIIGYWPTPSYAENGGSPADFSTMAIGVTNMVYNPGFEDGASSPSRWTLNKVNTNGAAELDLATANSGSRSVKLTVPTSADRALATQGSIPVEAGEAYDFSVYYKTENLQGQPLIQLSWYNGSTYLSAENIRANQVVNDWTKLAASVQAPANATIVTISLHNLYTPGTVWFDDVSLAKAQPFAAISPTSAQFDKFPLNQQDIQINMTVLHTTLTAISNGAHTLTSGADYTVSGDAVTIKKGYLASLPEGLQELAFSFSSGKTLMLQITITNGTSAGGNVVDNPGFEDGASSPAGWTLNKVNTNGTAELDLATANSGSRSVKLTVPTASDRAVVTRSGVPVQAGKNYNFSVYYKTENLAGQPLIQLSWYNGSTYLSADSVRADRNASEWKKFSMNVLSPVNATSVVISLHNIYTPGTVWFDDVSLHRIVLNSSISPSFAAFDQNIPAQQDIPVVIYANGNTLREIRSGGGILEAGTDYTLEQNQVILKKQYLSQLLSGVTAFEFAFSEGADQSFSLLIVNSTKLLASDVTFDKNELLRQPLTIDFKESEGELTALRIGNQLLTSQQYSVQGNRVTLNEGYLASLATKMYGLSFAFSSGSIASAALTIIDTTTPFTTNLLNNAGFEEGGGSPDSWQFSNDGTIGSWSWDDSVSHDGNKSIKLINGHETDISSIIHPYTVIVPDNAYQVETFYRTDNLQGDVAMSIEWYSTPDSAGFLSREIVTGVRNGNDWRKLFHEQIAPRDARYVKVSLMVKEGTGSVWFDQARLVNHNLLRNHGFEKGDSVPDSWVYDKQATNGSMELVSDETYTGAKSLKVTRASQDDIAIVSQPNIAVFGGKMYNAQLRYKTENGASAIALVFEWFNEAGERLRLDEITGAAASEWKLLTAQKWAPEAATQLDIQIKPVGGPGGVWLDEAELRQTLVDSARNLVPVTDLYDVNEQMEPADFWSLMPGIELNPPAASVWTQKPLADYYFGPTEGEALNYITLSTPELTLARDATVPVMNGLLGQAIAPGMPLAIAGDIEFNPLLSAHAGYSNKYFPRSMQRYVQSEYNPSYVLTGEPYFKERSNELLQYLLFSQWQPDGSNRFVSKYFPSQYVPHPEWAGGWDDVFDWEWLDGYGYKWSLHEPDHHVNSQIASTMINSYELYGNADYLQAAKSFYYNQVPRYGFHKGVWNNHVYYWTEYNPSGASAGITSDDSTDNVSSLVMLTAAKLGYYETDPQLKAQYLEYARGLLWYLVREFYLEGRWYYDGFENKLNPDRFAVSHDGVVIQDAYLAIVYLYKAGVDISEFLQYLSGVEEEYSEIWALLQRKAYLKMAKIYDGEPAPNSPVTFSTFVHTMSTDLNEVRFQDKIPAGFVEQETLDIRISKILPPDGNNPNWTIDPENDVVFTITPAQLEEGVIIPFAMPKRTTYKIAYEAVAASGFDRAKAVDEDSSVSAWIVDDDNTATFVRLTSGTSGEKTKSHTMPLNMPSRVNAENFLSFSAQLLFPFGDETSAVLETSPAPAGTVYRHDDDWGDLAASKYIYPIQSLYPVKEPVGLQMYSDSYGEKGRVLSATKAGDYVGLEFELFRPAEEYTVFAYYAKDDSRGIAAMYMDGERIGADFDLYASKNTAYDAPVPVAVDMGAQTLDAGKHELKYEVIGKNTSSKGYEIGLYEGLILQPTNLSLPSFSVYANGGKMKEGAVFKEGDNVIFTAKLQDGNWPGVRVETFIDDVPYEGGELEMDGSASDHVLKVVVSDAAANRKEKIYPFTVLANDRVMNNNANLSDLKVDGLTISGFNADVVNYTVSRPEGTSSIPTVTAAAEDANAAVDIEAAAAWSGKTKITVTAEDGVTRKTYTVHFILVPNAVENTGTNEPGAGQAVVEKPPAPKPNQDGIVFLALQAGQTEMTVSRELLEEAEQIAIVKDGLTLWLSKEAMGQVRELLNFSANKEEKLVVSIQAGWGEAEKQQLAQLSEQANAELKAASAVYDIRLSAVEDGEHLALPLTVSLAYDEQADAGLIGVYRLGEDGKLEYLGGKVNGDRIEAMLPRPGKVVVLAYDKTFEDVPAGHWAYRMLKETAARHLVEGVSDNAFEPSRDVNRAEFATLLVRMLGLETGGTVSFADVDPDAWYPGYVAAAAKAGLVNGTDTGLFAPERTITREEMAVMLVRAYALKQGSKNEQTPIAPIAAFADRDLTSEWARQALDAAASLGLVAGRSGDRFFPLGSTNRAEAAQAIYNLAKLDS